MAVGARLLISRRRGAGALGVGLGVVGVLKATLLLIGGRGVVAEESGTVTKESWRRKAHEPRDLERAQERE